MTNPVTATQDRFAELDIARFLAAALVVIYHYKSKYIEVIGSTTETAKAIYATTKYGYLGVDLFFLISGFVIFASALGRSPAQFAVSRITRIYPTFWVCLSLTAAIAWTIRGPQVDITFLQWAANLTLLHHAVGVADVDPVYWTLIVELKFYACVLLLMFAGVLGKYRFWVPIWLAFAVCYLFFKQPFFMGWFISPEYSAYFIAGIVFFLARRDGFSIWHVSVLTVSLLVASWYAFHTIDTFAKNISIIDRYIAVGVVWIFYFGFLLISLRRLAITPTRATLLVGGMTYPLYLLHNRVGKDIFDALRDQIAPGLLVCIIAAGMLALSLAIHVYLERRIADRLKAFLFRVLQKN